MFSSDLHNRLRYNEEISVHGKGFALHLNAASIDIINAEHGI